MALNGVGANFGTGGIRAGVKGPIPYKGVIESACVDDLLNT